MVGFPTFLCLCLLAIVLPEAESKCCYPDSNKLCDDNSQGTPCCGYRRCNLFCCNCHQNKDGKACRAKKPFGGRVFDLMDGSSKFTSWSSLRRIRSYDLNGDDMIDSDEFRVGFKSRIEKREVGPNVFDEYDINRDGFITADEIDDDHH